MRAGQHRRAVHRVVALPRRDVVERVLHLPRSQVHLLHPSPTSVARQQRLIAQISSGYQNTTEILTGALKVFLRV